MFNMFHVQGHTRCLYRHSRDPAISKIYFYRIRSFIARLPEHVSGRHLIKLYQRLQHSTRHRAIRDKATASCSAAQNETLCARRASSRSDDRRDELSSVISYTITLT